MRVFLTPLSKIPGPFLNSVSNLPLYYYTVRGNYHTYTISLHAKYGSIVRIGYNQISLANGSELRRVLATHTFPKGKVYETNVLPEQTTFTTTNPELNKTRRRQMGNTYSMDNMRAMEDTILEHGVLTLIRCWDAEIEKGAAVNYFYGFSGLAFDIIGVLIYGKSFDVLKLNDMTIIDNIHKLMVLSSIITILPVLGRFTWLFKDLSAARYQLLNMAHAAIMQRKNDMREKAVFSPHADILQKLLNTRDPRDGQALSYNTMIAEINMLLAAATDTTSNTLSWSLMYILHHPTVYQRLCQNIRFTFPDTTRPIRYDEAKTYLPYLTAVILESMRLNPAASGLFPRSVPTEGAMLCGQYQIPSTTEICLSFAASHRDPTVWPNPNVFDPERFMDAKGRARSRDLLAFSTGVRVCIGRHLAWIELYTVLANLLRRYNFELPIDSPYGPHRIKDGIPEDIPGLVFTTCGPKDPLINCRVHVSHAIF
ncbi:hypothetical protein LPJ66_003169 [Kickxella alabastrina]|uniref:Uncharacterized protein n=1 Tax=Kickxella alabastrina TaxID=61397 RepID=A0ACC1IND6_9FUNG|nr:hypothetical protein LPJ66_003169 [Kickxella alabastrina]